MNCAYLWGISHVALIPLLIPLKCCLSHSCADGRKHIDIFTRGFFYDEENIWLCFKSFFFSPPPTHTHVFLLSTQQPSQEWSSHPCKAVTAWLCVCVWVETSTPSPILREDLARVGLRSGMEATVPIWRNKTPLRPFVSQNNCEENTVRTKNSVEGNKIRLCTP